MGFPKMASQYPEVTEVTPEQLEKWLESGDTVLVDVREDFEHHSERIDGSHLHALSRFDPKAIRDQHSDKRVVFHCRSGKRSKDAAKRYQSENQHVFHLTGGIEAWKKSGRQVIRSAGATRIDVMRQVQIAAGALILLGVILGYTVSSALFGISAFVGVGLLFAGLTGWCGMAKILGAMPWNKSGCASACGSSEKSQSQSGCAA